MTQASTLDLQRRSLAAVWHPCTQMARAASVPPLPIVRGEGAWLHDADGKRYFDANSSWWVNLFGHSDAGIQAAIRRQLDTLPHVMLAGCTHEPAVRLAERLSALTGGALGLPVLLVVGLRLGCINHALLTAEAIRARGLPLAGWVANTMADTAADTVSDSGQDAAAAADIVLSLQAGLACPCWGQVPYLAEPSPAAVAAHLDLSFPLDQLAPS